MFNNPIQIISCISMPSYSCASANRRVLSQIIWPQIRHYHDPKHGFFEEEPPKSPYEQRLATAKDKLRWRTSMSEKQDEWKSKFGLFSSKKNNDMDTLMWFQRPIDLTISGWKRRREEKRVTLEIFMQQYLPERNHALGADLAAAHFIVHRDGSVKYTYIYIYLKNFFCLPLH